MRNAFSHRTNMAWPFRRPMSTVGSVEKESRSCSDAAMQRCCGVKLDERGCTEYGVRGMRNNGIPDPVPLGCTDPVCTRTQHRKDQVTEGRNQPPGHVRKGNRDEPIAVSLQWTEDGKEKCDTCTVAYHVHCAPTRIREMKRHEETGGTWSELKAQNDEGSTMFFDV